MHAIHPLIIDLTMVTIYAGLTTLLCKKLKQPIILGYLLAGILAGPYFNLLPTITDKEDLVLWADIGVIFLLFGLGLEFSFKKMVNVGKSAMITATANILFMLFLGYNTGLLLGWSAMDSFFLGSMISMSSTTIIIKAFNDLNIKKQKFVDLVFGVLIIEDLVGILMLVLLPTIALGKNINGIELALSAIKLVFFLILCFITGIYLVPTFLQKIQKFLNDEMLLLITISMCFGMVLLATYSGFSTALGAFIMGSILSETPLIERIEKNLSPLKDFFGAVFFISVGMMVNPIMFVTYAKPIFVITMIVIVGKILFSCFGFVASGQPLKTSIYGGFSLAQVGEFAFIIASLGMSLGVLSDKVYPIIVAVSVITTFLTPLMIKSADSAYKKIKKMLPETWLNYIDKYSTSTPLTHSEERLWGALFKNYLIRLSLFSFILYSIILFSTFIRPFIRELIPYRIPANIVMTLLTFMLMAPFLKALIGWNIVTSKFIKDKLSWLFPKKQTEEIELAVQCAQDEHHSLTETLHLENICNTLDDKTIRLRKFFSDKNQVSKIYYKLWMAKKANRLPLIILTSFRILVCSFFIVTVVHKFLSENPRITFLLLLLTIFFISRSRWLLDQYIKIENQFLHNLKGQKRQEELEENKEEK
ncbi:MAG: cation:proton antiporter [Alphaproteobacteria bacterium]|nr:cation:proton antiporter [Alphaproteobacteria bacterium]